MLKVKKLFKKHKILFLIVSLAALLRFYNLDWGDGYFFHPDEHHISIAINRLSYPEQMNPELFSYGSFTVYLIFFTKLILSKFSADPLVINNILIGRFYSALFSTATIPIIYLIARKILDKKHSLMTAFLVAILPGLIQQAHFTTPESILIFWILLSLLFLLNWQEKKDTRLLFYSAVSMGIAAGTKIVAATMLPVFLIAFLINLKKTSPKKIAQSILLFLFAGLTAAVSFLMVFPYALIDKTSLIHSINYEVGVGKGDPLVFYTRQFIDTAPVVFQLKKVFPLALGPFVLLLGGVGALFVLVKIFNQLKMKKIDYHLLLILVAFFSVLLPQLFLFAKWTRFVSPSFPFWAIFTIYPIQKWGVSKKAKLTKKFFLITAGTITVIWTFMFFSIYLKKDVRIKADQWVQNNVPREASLLTEQGNVYEVPLKNYPEKNAFDFYHLDENPSLQTELPSLVYESDYFIIQSRRIFYNHQRLPDKFPITANFYNQLFSGNLGFVEIKEFTSYPSLEIDLRLGPPVRRTSRFGEEPQGSERNWKLEIRDEVAEETWSVFDHPVIRIYEKKQDFPIEYYEEILNIS